MWLRNRPQKRTPAFGKPLPDPRRPIGIFVRQGPPFGAPMQAYPHPSTLFRIVRAVLVVNAVILAIGLARAVWTALHAGSL